MSSGPGDDFTFHDPHEEFGAFGEPSFEDELEFEAEIEREATAHDDFEPEAAAAPAAPPAPWEAESQEPVPTAVQADDAEMEDAPPDDDEPMMEEPTQPAGPPREVAASFMVPVEINGRATSRPLNLLKPKPRMSKFDLAGLSNGSLLSTPMSEIRDELDREALATRKAKEAAEAAAAVAAANAEEEGFENELTNSEANAAAGAPAPQPTANLKTAELWVDKYAPKAFMDLLSDERLNRHVLRWVKQWDDFVFGPTNVRSATAAAAMMAGQVNGGRPERPIMLISGPPGLGKTTLAHIVAKHAGYRPAEINASDERSAKVLKQRVAEASEVQSVFTDRRPPLIVIDEIDGAMGGADGTGAVNELIRLANASISKPGSGGGAEQTGPAEPGARGGRIMGDKGGMAKSKPKRATSGLMRPVICICNDIHAPALRPLRAVAELVEFKTASNSQLLARLKAVCKSEKMSADAHTLTALANLSGHDVRTCLNTLQFVRAKSSTLTEKSLESSGVGRKSVAKSTWQLWKQVFVAPPMRKMGSSGAAKPLRPNAPPPLKGHETAAEQQQVNPSEQLLKDLELADVSRVLEGAAENYLSISYTDPSLTRTFATAESLSCYDVLQNAMYTKGHFGLMGYATTTVVAVHTLCSVPALREQIAFPRAEREHRQARQSNLNLLRSWQAGLAPPLYQFYSSENLLVDVLSPLLTILTPPIKPVATHLLASEERKQLAELVDKMIGFGLAYKQMSQVEGGYAYKLDPPLAELLPPMIVESTGEEEDAKEETKGMWQKRADGGWQKRDSGEKPTNGRELPRELPAAVRQLLGTELQRELMRRHHAFQMSKDTGGGGASSSGAAGGAIGNGGGLGTSPFKPSPQPTALKPVAKALSEKDKIDAEKVKVYEKKDMFGRVIPQTGRGEKRKAGSMLSNGPREIEQLPVRFKFHEGVTDAVRRPVKVRDLL